MNRLHKLIPVILTAALLSGCTRAVSSQVPEPEPPSTEPDGTRPPETISEPDTEETFEPAEVTELPEETDQAPAETEGPFPTIDPAEEPAPTIDPDEETSETSEAEDEVLKVRLEIPQSVQENGHYCGPASLQMVLAYHGIERTQTELAEELKTSMVTGTEYEDMARVLNTYLYGCEFPEDGEPGYRSELLTPSGVTETDLEVLKERVIRDIGTGDPVFIAINLQALYPDQPKANHFEVITGYQMKDGEILYYYIVDSYSRVQHKKYKGLKIFTPEEIRNALDTNVEPAYVW